MVAEPEYELDPAELETASSESDGDPVDPREDPTADTDGDGIPDVAVSDPLPSAYTGPDTLVERLLFARRARAVPTLSRTAASAYLRALGFRVRTTGEFTQVVRAFQECYMLGRALAVDGKFGPLTSAALRKSYAAHRAGRPDLSPHFSFRTFTCKCGGAYPTCRRFWMRRRQIERLEKYRSRVGAFTVISGCRCPGHNARVGGKSNSQHKYGNAADVPGTRSSSQVRSWKLFAGIGYGGATHTVQHVDSRDLGPNTTHSSNAAPAFWKYNNR